MYMGEKNQGYVTQHRTVYGDSRHVCVPSVEVCWLNATNNSDK